MSMKIKGQLANIPMAIDPDAHKDYVVQEDNVNVLYMSN
jgi:hypothetical protein